MSFMVTMEGLTIRTPEFSQFLRTYRGKIMLVAFIGIQIPLITLILSFSIVNPGVNTIIPYQVWGFVCANAIATALTLSALYNFLSPILITSDILNQYFTQSETDNLPTDFSDQISTLIADTDEALERLTGVIQHLTSYDTLTGLPNRELFKRNVQQAIAAMGEEQQFALIVLDLVNLKDINSTLGREVGNILLTKVTQRLASRLDAADTLARFGGNDFVVLRTNTSDHDSLISLSQDLLDSFAQPFLINSSPVSCTAKIGITIYPLDGNTVEQLLQNADTAIYLAEQQSLNAYQFYTPAMSGKLKRILAIKENLRSALERNELYILYQPRIEIATGCLVGVEALLRWYSPELGLVSPNEFIPIAEATNAIISIGEWVLQTACWQNKQWQHMGIPPLKVSVNLSACQFKQNNLLETIDRILNDTDLEPTYLELEITESMLVEDLETAIALLGQLKQRGISIALDDFGTGYSSLRYLQKLPIDTLKIDRSFVTNIALNPEDPAIARAIIALGQSLELNITAEGVETQEQLTHLQNQGCHEVQGYYFSQPLPPEMLQSFLAKCNSEKL
ncbi:MAG: EAL domain-containing protein [Cyanobacteria bacterium J06623_1]